MALATDVVAGLAHQDMIVVGHQNVRHDRYASPQYGVLKFLDERLVVGLVMENPLLVVSAVIDVVEFVCDNWLEAIHGVSCQTCRRSPSSVVKHR